MSIYRVVLITALILTGCSSDSPRMPNPRVYLARASQLVTKPKAVAQVNVLDHISSEMVAKLSTATVAVKLQNSGAQALLSKTGENRGAVTYSSTNNISVTLLNGIVVASRGISGDLMSSDIRSFQPTIFNKWAPTYLRSYFWLDGEEHIVSETFSCVASAIGSEDISVVGSHKRTTHIRESCSNDTEIVTNDYWVSPRIAAIIKSNQWLGREIGFLEITSIKY